MLPRISIVTCSYNQGRFIGRTIESVLAQKYPNLEHIVVDGMSSDETPKVLSQYSHLRVIRERDRGQGEAINKGFRLATGQILGFLNSDDLLLPGALHAVAREIDPARGRHIVTGRSIYIDENDVPTGLEHPCLFTGHWRLLQTWKHHTIAQPSTFWTQEVWRRCGPLDESEHHVLDVDLFCRFSQRYRFHVLDQVLSAYRLHQQSKTCSASAEKTLAEALRVSRKYWGPWWHPRRWYLEASLAWHRHTRERAQHSASWLNASWQRAGAGRHLAALAARLRCWLLAPELALRRFWARRGRTRGWDAQRWAETLIFRSFTALHLDGLAGPTLKLSLQVSPGQTALHFAASEALPGYQPPCKLTFLLDGEVIGEQNHTPGQPMRWQLPLAGVEPGQHELTVLCDRFVVPRDLLGVEDYRPLCYRLLGLSGWESKSRAA